MKLFNKAALALCCSPLIFTTHTFAANGIDNNQVFQRSDKKPNIVYILLDDQRYDAMGFINPLVKTPNMDKIAHNGTYFKNAFVTTSLSSPSRASIMTGMYAHNHGISDNNAADLSKLHFFPEKLKESGYQTGFFGKWHFGAIDEKAKAGFAGFDRWVGFIGQGDYWPINRAGKPAMLNVDGKLTPQKGYITDEITDYAVDWLNHLDKSKPFMLYMGHKGVHANFSPAIRHIGAYKNVNFPVPDTYADTPENYKNKPMWVKNQRNSWHGVDYAYNKNTDMQQFQRDYYETLMSVDESIGRVQKWLKDHNLDKNTIIMVMGDNGFMFGEHGLIDKRTAYEESMRVPLIASGPGIAKNKVVEDIVANIDIAPTILDAAGIKKPANYDGESFLGLGTDRKDLPPRNDSFVYEYFWEYNFPFTPTTFAIRTPQYKYIQYYGVWDKEELYNIKDDPQEKNNLIGSKDKNIIETKISLRKKLFDGLKSQSGRNVIPYNQRDNEGSVFRYKVGGEKMADYPAEWLRGYDPRDKYSGQVPDSVDKDRVVENVFVSFEKATKLINEKIKEQKQKEQQ